MAFAVELTRPARSDVDDYLTYALAQSGDTRAAADWLNGLEAALRYLAANPQRQPLVNEPALHKDRVRQMPYHSHRIVFQVENADKVVTVFRILHSGRKRPGTLNILPPALVPPNVFLSAGEASGEHYGAMVARAVRARVPESSLFGLGGKEMETAGLKRIVRAEDVAHMGITEVVLRAPDIYRQYRKLIAGIERNPPDVAVLIDFPDVNFRLARRLKKMGVPVIWFVSPQLWAWKPKRLLWVQQRVKRMLVIFPFEEAFYKARGVDAEFVGHPLAELPLPAVSREEYARQAALIHQDQWNYNWPELPDWVKPVNGEIKYELDPGKEWVALLPGSRIGEILRNLPEMVDAAVALGGNYEFIIPLAPTLTPAQIKLIQTELGDNLPPEDSPRFTCVSDARAALFHARASIVASGTATVQAAVIGNPFVIVYRVSLITYALAKKLIKLAPEIPAQMDTKGRPPVGMVNLVAGRRIVPELLQEEFTAANIVAKLKPLLEDSPERAQMQADLVEVRNKLLIPGLETSIDRTAETVLQQL